MGDGSKSSSKPQEQEYDMTEYGFKRYNICGMRFETTPNYTVKKAVGQVRATGGVGGTCRACGPAALIFLVPD